MSAPNTFAGTLVPMVVEQTARGERAYDIYSRLLKDNIVFVGTSIDDMIANLIFKRIIGTLDWPFGSAISVLLLILLGIIINTYNRYLGINRIFQSFKGE